MPNIAGKRLNKDGTTSYYIKIFLSETPDGKQQVRNWTWKAPASMRPTTAEKQALKEAQREEDRVKRQRITQGGKVLFADYAANWLEDSNHAPKTREQYDYLLARINKELGHLQLEKVTEETLKSFYRKLRKEGAREAGKSADPIEGKIRGARKAAKLTQTQLAAKAGLSEFTVGNADQGKRISYASAEKLSSALDMGISDLFSVCKDKSKLSDATVWHHHKLINTILNSATPRIIPYNPASGIGPPRPDEEVVCLNDEEAILFVKALLKEPDIRVKTALMLTVFSGVRKEELCGLSFRDINGKHKSIMIRRTSQYIRGQGIIEGKTKTKKSVRDITVTPFVLDLLKEYRQWWREHRTKWGSEWQDTEERLFIQDNGKPIFPSTIYHWLQKFLKRNGLPKVSLHSLRHTFISLQILNGVDIKTLQARTGHAKASTLLNTYAHYFEQAQDAAAAQLEAALMPEKTG